MPNRREYLGALATGLSVAVGGCLGDSDDGQTTDDEPDDTATGEPTETPDETETGEPTETPDGTDESKETPLEGTIDITGSSTVYPLADAVAEVFIQQHPDVAISVAQTGTGGGFRNHFCTGEADFNNASRPITAEEEQLCADSGVESHELRLGVDAVTVLVNTDNDWVDCMTTDELREIWRADGATTWSDVDSDWPDEQINRYGPAETSGTFDYLEARVLGDDASHTSDYEPTEQDTTIVQAVEQDEYGIGYVGFAYYRANSDRVKAVGLDDGSGCVEPTLDTADGGEYPLARPLFTYVSTDRLGEAHVTEFARFFVEQSADEELVADQVGYVPNTEARMQEELDALNAAIDDAQ
ncbi:MULTISPECIES: PstS family phosphate ABC transporter substrate-binding protein [Haloarcula]|uniref:PstS family phosphate ABC transporter substrate-binding protein n=1 Tax=Haloarcula TaxID=2237 RepID=UPI0023E89B1C|nr:PstS family phosphate ABC transporter substrate-binding protein [Halomicroarcula sp. SHR3]